MPFTQRQNPKYFCPSPTVNWYSNYDKVFGKKKTVKPKVTKTKVKAPAAADVTVTKKKGRPKGSKNKPKDAAQAVVLDNT